ncbi:MAG: hypothetical protein KatS3mg114_0752 [Planctomycetaceae bacterium]|nr:MAG: hypothetical protein KatS3mg114_0752 [Planctomycetaceae bacterium]
MRVRDFWRAGHPPSLVSAFLYFDISFMVWVLLGALANAIVPALGLNEAQRGLLVATPLLGGALLRIVLGWMTDQIGPRLTGLVGLTVTVVPLLMGWLWADSFGELLLVGLLLGVAGASFAAALPLASRWYPPEYQGLALGIAGAGNSGTALATFFGPRLADHVGWQNVFGLALIPVLSVLILYAALAKDSPQQPPPKPLRDYLKVLRWRDTWLFCAFYSVTFGGFVGLASFLNSFFRVQYGLSPVTAGSFATVCVMAGSFLRPVGGWLADRYGGIRVLLLIYGLAGATMLGLSLLPPLVLSTVLMTFGLGLLGMGNGAVFQLVPQRFGRDIGVMTGIIGAAGGVGGFCLPSLLGALKQLTGSFSAGLLLFAVVGCGGCAWMLWQVAAHWQRSFFAEGGRALSVSLNSSTASLEGVSSMIRRDARPVLVVIGTGMAAAKLVSEILARDPQRYTIRMFGEEPGGTYNRVLLSHVLGGRLDPQRFWMQPLEWYTERGVTVHAGVRADRIDRQQQVVYAAGGKVAEPYDELILATGSRPYVPPCPGVTRKGVFVFRTFADCAAIADHAQHARRAVVVGGGLLGLEAAYGLLAHQLEVTVLEKGPHVMMRQLDETGGKLLQRQLEALGVRVLTNARVAALEGPGDSVAEVVLNEGTRLPAELVIISCGIQPNVELAVNCGLQVKRGIVVDDQLRTSDPNIYAVGECAEHRDQLYGLVEPAYEQANVLAEVLTQPQSIACYRGSCLATTLKVMGVEVAVMERPAGESPTAVPEAEMISHLDLRAGDV